MNSERSPFGVGIIGAGLAFQAIHARVLASLPQDFALRAVWDPDSGRAAEAAQWLGLDPIAQLDDLLGDPSIDVVVIASPARFHAEQAIAAMRAGKKAVLVEKPLCSTAEEADAIAQVAAETGTALLVGTMHVHDPAWLAAREQIERHAFAPSLVRSSIVLPPNARFEEWATEPLAAVQPPANPPPPMTPEQLMQLCILELAIHDLPLVRKLAPEGQAPKVHTARLRNPMGYAVSLSVGETLVDLSAVLHGHWQTDWALAALGPQGRLDVSFTPSFVMAGSGTMTWQGDGGDEVHVRACGNGYVGQWHALAAMLRGERDRPDPREVSADFRFAHAIAEQAVQVMSHGDRA